MTERKPSVKSAPARLGRRVSDCQKSLAEFAPAGAKKVRIIFGGGVYVAENTLRHASVEFVRYKRTNYARGMAQAFSNADPAQRFAFESVSKMLF